MRRPKNPKEKASQIVKISEVPTLARSVMMLWAAPTLHPKIATKSDIVQVRRAAIVACWASIAGNKCPQPALRIWSEDKVAIGCVDLGKDDADEEAGRSKPGPGVSWKKLGGELIEPFWLVYLWPWDVAGCTG
jgi:Zn ribbon nucleic-acid-binding protein